MPWKVKKPADVPDWLRPYCTLFLQKLADQGYAPATMRTYAGATALFCQEVARRGLGHGQLVGETLSKVRAAALKGIYPNEYNKKIYCLERFIDALVEAGVAERPKPTKKVPTALERLQAEYEVYLREQRGLTEATIYHCVRFLDRFMTFRFGEKLGNLNDITPAESWSSCAMSWAGRYRTGTRLRRRTCAACSASCSGVGKRSAIWRAAFRAWRQDARRTCRDH